jgi:hypothetical protein
MKIRFVKSLAVALAMVVGGTAMAQDYYEVEDTQCETVSCEEVSCETVSFLGGGGDDCSSCFDSCTSCGPTVYAALEIPWLQINESSVTSQFLDQLINQNVPGAMFNDFGIPPAYGQELSFRLYGGVENCNGFGIRGAYWQFEDGANGTVNGLQGVIPVIGTTQIDSLSIFSSHRFQVGDLELSQRADFCGWNLMMTTGIRVAQVDQRHGIGGTGHDVNNPALTGAIDISAARRFSGAGLTASIGWEREIRCSGFGLYGNLRGSVLFGDTKYSAALNTTGAANNFAPPSGSVTFAKVKDQPVVVTEIALGAQYKRNTNYGVMFVRAGVEGQVWEFAPVALGLLDESVGLFGPAFTIGFER